MGIKQTRQKIKMVNIVDGEAIANGQFTLGQFIKLEEYIQSRQYLQKDCGLKKMKNCNCRKFCASERCSHETCVLSCTDLCRSQKVKNSEAVARRCSLKKVFLEISQNSQENTCVRVSF